MKLRRRGTPYMALPVGVVIDIEDSIAKGILSSDSNWEFIPEVTACEAPIEEEVFEVPEPEKVAEEKPEEPKEETVTVKPKAKAKRKPKAKKDEK